MSYSVFPQVFFIVVASIAYILLKCKAQLNNETRKFANTCSILLVIFVSVLLYLAAAGRGIPETRSLTLTPFASYSFVLTVYNSFDVLKLIFENILVFIPLGILLPEALSLSGKKWAIPFTVAMGAFLSFVIELSQYTYAIGFSEADDLINNTVGTAIGCGIFAFAQKVKIDGDGIRISHGWVRGLLPAAIITTAMLGIVLYREIILYNM